MKNKLNHFSLLACIIFISCSSQKSLPTADYINSRYYNLLPQDKSIISVKVVVKEVKTEVDKIVDKLYTDGDTLLADQFTNLHAILIYNKKSDSVTVFLSPLEVAETSDMFEGVKDIKQGYYEMVIGAFMIFKPILIDGILSGERTNCIAIPKSGNVSFDVTNKESQFRYTFTHKYKDVAMSGLIGNQSITGLFKASVLGEKMVFDYQEFVFQLIKSNITYSYQYEGTRILLSQIQIKTMEGPATVDLTMFFSDWRFE